jgi:DNA-binding response OmpR family regulator
MSVRGVRRNKAALSVAMTFVPHALQAGVIGYLPKPFDESSLLNCIQTALDRAKGNKARRRLPTLQQWPLGTRRVASRHASQHRHRRERHQTSPLSAH